MKISEQAHIVKTKRIFERRMEACFSAIPEAEALVAPYIPSLYRRYLYTAVVRNTYVTPAAIMRHGTDWFETGMAMPHARQGEAGITYATLAYTIEEHPVYSDLEVLLDTFETPHDLKQMHTWADAAFLSRFSIPDITYLAFLTATAMRLEFLRFPPSIYAVMAQTAPRRAWNEFIALEPTTRLAQITLVTLRACAEQLMSLVPDMQIEARDLEVVMHSPPHLEMLKEDLFLDWKARIFQMSIDADGEEGAALVERLNEAYESLVYAFGIIMDQSFYTPLGFFLQLIQPIYQTGTSPTRACTRLYEALMTGGETESALYVPVGTHAYTALGAAFLAGGRQPYQPAAPRHEADITPIWKALSMKTGQKALQEAVLQGVPTEERIYILKAAWAEEESCCAFIAVSELAPLEAIHGYFARIFCFDHMCAYSFFAGEEANPFIEYTGGENAARRKLATIPFAEFCPDSGRFLLEVQSASCFSGAYDGPFTLRISVVQIEEGVYGTIYPETREVSDDLVRLQRGGQPYAE